MTSATAFDARGHATVVEGPHAPHVLACLGERRDAAVAPDRALAGVVRRQGERDIAPEALQQIPEVPDPTVHVLMRVEGVTDSEEGRALRHELHQSAGAFG